MFLTPIGFLPAFFSPFETLVLRLLCSVVSLGERTPGESPLLVSAEAKFLLIVKHERRNFNVVNTIPQPKHTDTYHRFSPVSMSRRIRDAFPFLQPAGRVEVQQRGPIFEGLEVPPTPKSIAPYRKSQSCQPGRRRLHFGIARDPPPPDMRFGRKAQYTSTTAACLYDPTAVGVAAIANEQAERIYQTRSKEPLGHSPAAVGLPKSVLHAAHVFGCKSVSSETVKEVMYGAALATLPSNEAAERRLGPGEAKKRDYDWASVNIDPTKHRFGRSTAGSKGEVMLKPTSIVPVVSCRSAQRAESALSVQAFAKFDKPYTATVSDFALVDTADSDEQGLGRAYCPSSTLRRLRAADPSPVAHRSFGIPTIRSDIPRPKALPSFSNANNYGDDATAGQLLNPATAASTGITAADQDHVQLSREAACRTFKACGVRDEDVDAMVAEATSKQPGGGVTASALRSVMEQHGY